MRKIFAGMLFIFLNFHFNLPSSTIGLTPSFVGYYLLLGGLTELSGFSPRFIKIRPAVMVALVYSAILYVLDLVGAGLVATEPRTFALGAVSSAFSLFISYYIIIGIKDIEKTNGHNLETTPLYAAWWIWAVFSFILFVAFFVPQLTIFFVVIIFILAINFLFKLRKTSNLFSAQKPEAPVGPTPVGTHAIVLIFMALVIGCAGAFVYGRHVIMYRATSSCGQLQLTYHRVSQVLTHTSSLSNQTQTRGNIGNPEFIWSPCGRFLAVNSDSSHWGSRRADIIDLHGTVRIMPDKHFIQERHEEAQMPASTTLNNIIEAEKWLDSENLLFNFSWPYFSATHSGAVYESTLMSGWFTFHFPTWTITELVVLYP